MFVESFSNFFMSTSGAITTGVLVALLMGLFALSLKRKNRLSVKALTYAAICIALATVLSNIKLFDMPYGGTVTACSMLFVSLIGYWFGPTAGITAAVSYGLLQLIFDPYVIHPMQLLLDYPLAFGALGVSGFLSNKKYGLYTGYIAGSLGRAFFSFLSGVIFFAEYAGDMNVFLYSFLYQMSYIAPEILITVAVISIGAMKKAIMQVKSTVTA